jgi:tetratricopeptide (TPR) repeat protein
MPYGAYEDDGPSGPGCVIWGGLGFFMVLMAGAIVFLAAFAGWSDGLRVAQGNATAEAQSEVNRQCDFLQSDLQQGNLSLAQQRMTSLQQVTPEVPCIATYAPIATARYLEMQPTETPTPTPTEIVEEAISTEVVTEATEDVVEGGPTEAAGDDPYDLPSLLAEAESLLAEGETLDAIEWLQAIQNIDPTYQKARIDQMLFNAYLSEAEYHYRSPDGNLGQGIAFTNLAEEYGDIGDWAFEREVATLYLSAQNYRNANYGEAIRLLNQIMDLAPNYKDARNQLYSQYVAFGDGLAASFSHCEAVLQYDNALRMQNSPDVANKRSVAERNCQLGATGTPAMGTPGANTTPIAPIGVPGT